MDLRMLRGQMLRSQLARARRDDDSEISRPTLAHVPGVEVGGSYCTTELRMRGRQAVLTPHAALKKPREMFTSTREARLVHLGRGKVMMR